MVRCLNNVFIPRIEDVRKRLLRLKDCSLIQEKIIPDLIKTYKMKKFPGGNKKNVMSKMS